MGEIRDIFNDSSKKLAILIDPDKIRNSEDIATLTDKINFLNPTFIFVGGSTVDEADFDRCIVEIKQRTQIPVIIFPGSYQQISEKADGILFLSLISGRNPDYLIGHQVRSAHLLKKMAICSVPTGYIVIDGGKNSSVAYVSQTTPIPSDQNSIAVKTAIAGEMLGMSTIFLDAGSGAKHVVPESMISAVKGEIDIPLIVGGGIRSIEEVERAFKAGADIVVIGNKIEEDNDFLLDLKGVRTNSTHS